MPVEEQLDYLYNILHSPNKCDIYRLGGLDAPKPTALIVVIHGGAWMMGTKTKMRALAHTLCKTTKAICVVPDYSLSQLDSMSLQHFVIIDWALLGILSIVSARGSFPFLCLFCVTVFITVTVLIVLIRRRETKRHSHPAHVQDIADCLTWVNKQQSMQNLDIILLGHSAGAHLASLVVLNPRFLCVELKMRIKGVVCISGVYSFWRLQQSIAKYVINRGVFSEPGWQLTDKTYKCFQDFQQKPTLDDYKNHEIYQKWLKVVDAWPLMQLEYNVDFDCKPKFLLMTSELDLSLIAHASDFKQALLAKKFHTQHLHFPKATHFTIIRYWEQSHRHICDQVVKFVRFCVGNNAPSKNETLME